CGGGADGGAGGRHGPPLVSRRARPARPGGGARKPKSRPKAAP
ncbi:MAG: hypothetical protein AVDCRST_MAG41-3491, partial [uncultured Corynebacteriales bacterium]